LKKKNHYIQEDFLFASKKNQVGIIFLKSKIPQIIQLLWKLPKYYNKFWHFLFTVILPTYEN